jgi:hypothetical protein
MAQGFCSVRNNVIHVSPCSSIINVVLQLRAVMYC